MAVAASMMLVVTLSTPAAAPVTPAAPTLKSASESAPAIAPLRTASASVEDWMIDRAVKRPAALPILYATLGGLHAADVYSTRRALGAGANEVNPVVRKASGNSGAMLAVKALATAGTVYFSERAWKKNRKGAVILMAVLNGVTAAVVAKNLQNAR